MFYKCCFLIDGRIPFFLHYHPTHHPFSPVLNRQARALSGARAVRFRFYILYFARVRSAFPAFAGRYSSIQVPAFITSAQHTSDTECCFKNMVERMMLTMRMVEPQRIACLCLNASERHTAILTAIELYT